MKYTAITVSILCLLLAGCSVIVPKKADDQYVLKSTLAAPLPGMCANGASVQVADPETAPGLDGKRIAVFDTPEHINYYTGANWAAPLPDVLQQFFARSLEKSQHFRAVSTDMENLSSDIIVRINVNDFEVRNAALPVVKVNITFKLLAGKTRRVLAVIPMEKNVTPVQNHMPQIIDAFNQAVNDMAVQLVQAISSGEGCSMKLGTRGGHAHP